MTAKISLMIRLSIFSRYGVDLNENIQNHTRELLSLARQSIEHGLQKFEVMPIESGQLDPFLSQPGAVQLGLFESVL